MKKSLKIVIVVVLIMAGVLLWKIGTGNLGKGTKMNSLSGPAEMQIFNSEDNSFEFSYPKDLKVTETALEGVEGGKRILVESAEAKKGFEITSLPFDEAGPLTQERILQDVPDMEMNNVKNISVGENISALSFESVDENLGKTFEIWFVSGGNLFEARTYIEYAQTMGEIMKTWKTK